MSRQVEKQKLDKEDEIDKEFDYMRSGKYHTRLEIPEGYTVNYLPENLEIKNDLWDASITYEHVDDEILYSYEMHMKFIRLESKHFKAYNDFIKELSRAFKESIVLVK